MTTTIKLRARRHPDYPLLFQVERRYLGFIWIHAAYIDAKTAQQAIFEVGDEIRKRKSPVWTYGEVQST